MSSQTRPTVLSTKLLLFCFAFGISTSAQSQSSSLGSTCFSSAFSEIYPNAFVATSKINGSVKRFLKQATKLKAVQQSSINVPETCIQELIKMKGDVDRDGSVTDKDAALISRLSSGLTQLDLLKSEDVETMFRADIDENGYVGPTDRVTALNLHAGLYSQDEVLGFISKQVLNCTTRGASYVVQNGRERAVDANSFSLEYAIGKKMRLHFKSMGISYVVNSASISGTLYDGAKYCILGEGGNGAQAKTFNLFVMQFPRTNMQYSSDDSGFLTDSAGKAKLLNYFEAEAACSEKNGRLATAREIANSVRSYGGEIADERALMSIPVIDTRTWVYPYNPVYSQLSPTAVVDFYFNNMFWYGGGFSGIATNETYWTSTNHPSNPSKFAYAFDGKSGNFKGQNDKNLSKLAVKCIAR